MSSGDASVVRGLEQFVPAPSGERADWEDVVRRSGGRRRLFVTHRRAVLVAMLIGVAATLIATPAFGLRGLISDLFGRTNVKFAGKTAPLEVKRDFYDLGLGAPPSMAPHAIAAEVRRVASFGVGRTGHVLWVAPTRSGGFCWEFSRASGGCNTDRKLPRGVKYPHGYVNAGALSVTVGERFDGNVGSVTHVEGYLLDTRAHALAIAFADGTRQQLRFYYVSKPIDAGFFFASIPAGHDTTETRPLAVELLDSRGRLIAREPFFYETAAERARAAARTRAQLKKLEQRHMPPPIIRSPALPPPTQPLQQGTAEGVSVVAGRNGVVVFDTSHAAAAVRPLIAGRAVAYGCFRRLPYNAAPVDLATTRTTAARVSIRIQGMQPPFMGCDVEGTYGHTWPDRNHSHSAVEIAFTPAAARFFEDRAAARDLALFVRSSAMHTIRKLNGRDLGQAIRRRYGAAITKLDSTSSPLPSGRIGYVTGTETTYVERSTTGRRFFVRVRNGRIAAENVKPLGFVF